MPMVTKRQREIIPLFSYTESEDDQDDQDILLNFVALVGLENSSSDEDTTDSEDEWEIDVKKEYREFYISGSS